MMGNNPGNADVIRLYRKASVLFNLSINLLRLLELITWQMPDVFLTGSRVSFPVQVHKHQKRAIKCAVPFKMASYLLFCATFISPLQPIMHKQVGQ